MAASSSKPTAVHFSLVFFVATTVILAIVCYMVAKENTLLAAKAKAETEKASVQTNALNTAVSEIGTLKKLLGYPDFTEIGPAENAPENTVVWAVKRDLSQYGMDQVQPNPANPTVAATLQSLRSTLNETKMQAQAEQNGVQETKARLAQELAMHLAEKEKLSASQASSESQLQKTIADRNELIAGKDQEISKWRSEYLRERAEKETLHDELVNTTRQKDAEITELENQLDFKTQQLYDLENLSFDKPDGAIVRVDNTTRTVWINLGSDDNLRKHISFSVYTRNNLGVGRGRADIKAKIQVTNIIDKHLAEARILTEDVSRPIQPDDPIYSPAWSKGSKEYFSFVGVLDMDQDGKSDRELLHNILETNGSGIEVEVNDKGERIPADGKLTVKTKYLVIGDTEDPTDFPLSDADKQQEIKDVMAQRDALLKEARRQGIRAIKFSDFLNYIGHEPQQRLFNVGDERPFNLKTGTRPAATDDVLGGKRLPKDQIPARFRGSSSKNN
ncbi:hypothetical protein [Planctomicrobium sp. SH664]|uniref:hypothetical protein n=1 Tax=Planctomicrobium sp. SH664 TaxID=3448125 RepID=UPI003F5BF063